MEHIETIELDSSQSSITFSSIPQDYDDLVLKVSARGDEPDVMESTVLKPNGQTINSSSVNLRGSGSSVVSFSASEIRAGRYSGSNSTANTFGNVSVYISNYSKAQAKSFSTDAVGEDNGGETSQLLGAGLWDDTASITSLTFEPRRGANFISGSTFSLYGVTAGGDGTVTTE